MRDDSNGIFTIWFLRRPNELLFICVSTGACRVWLVFDFSIRCMSDCLQFSTRPKSWLWWFPKVEIRCLCITTHVQWAATLLSALLYPNTFFLFLLYVVWIDLLQSAVKMWQNENVIRPHQFILFFSFRLIPFCFVVDASDIFNLFAVGESISKRLGLNKTTIII